MTTATPLIDDATTKIVNDARDVIAAAQLINQGARAHNLHSKACGVQMHLSAWLEDGNRNALERIPADAIELRRLIAAYHADTLRIEKEKLKRRGLAFSPSKRRDAENASCHKS
ncbi:MAG: hypothetical protein ACIALR_04230 [Blastopirellula sp. JB062]